MNKAQRFSPKIRERAVRVVVEHRHEPEPEWATIISVTAKPGYDSATPRRRMRQPERDVALRDDSTTVKLERIKAVGPKIA